MGWRSLLLIFVWCCTVVAALAQVPQLTETKISVRFDNTPLPEVLRVLSSKTGIPILFSEDLLPSGKRVSLQANQVPLEDILQQALIGTRLRYQVVGQQIVISFNPKPELLTWTGYIIDATSGEKMIGAVIADSSGQIQTVSNEYGFFNISTPTTNSHLIVHYIGYQQKWITLPSDSKKPLNIKIAPNLYLPTIVIQDSFSTTNYSLKPPSIKKELIDKLLSFGGEAELIKAIQLQPGVSTGPDGVGGIIIQGGNPDQNLILFDGVPLYYPLHAAGVYSIFNADAVRNVQLYTGYIPASYAGRLSGVLDIRTREGNREHWNAEAGISPMLGRVLFETPFAKGKGAILVGGRYSWANWLLQPISKRVKAEDNKNGVTSYSFYDLNAKINYKLSNRDEIFFSLYTGNDDYGNSTSFENKQDNSQISSLSAQHISFGNNVMALRWQHLFKNGVFSNLSIYNSQYNFNSSTGLTYIVKEPDLGLNLNVRLLENTLSNIQEQGAQYKLFIKPKRNLEIKTGFNYQLRQFSPAAAQQSLQLQVEDLDSLRKIVDEASLQPDRIFAEEGNLFLELDWNITSKWKLESGFNASRYLQNKDVQFYLQPRGQLSFTPSPYFQIGLATGWQVQPMHLLSGNEIGLPNDLWVPATARVRAQTSWQHSLLLGGKVSEYLQWHITGYWKEMQHLITYNEFGGIGLLNASNWENKVLEGKGLAYGVATGFHLEADPFTLMISYQLSRSFRQFDEINNGLRFPYRYDRLHDLKLNAVWKPSSKWQLNAAWIYATGMAITLQTVKYPAYIWPNFFYEQLVVPSGKNNFRLPAQHRLDVEARYSWSHSKWEHRITFGAYNVYNRVNPIYYRVGPDLTNPGRFKVFQGFLMPLLPYCGYSVKFGARNRK